MRDIVAYATMAFVFLIGLGALTLALDLIENPRPGESPTAERVEGVFFAILSVALLVIAVVGACSVPSWR